MGCADNTAVLLVSFVPNLMMAIDNEIDNHDNVDIYDNHDNHDNDDNLSGADNSAVLFVSVAHIATFGPFCPFSSNSLVVRNIIAKISIASKLPRPG